MNDHQQAVENILEKMDAYRAPRASRGHLTRADCVLVGDTVLLDEHSGGELEVLGVKFFNNQMIFLTNARFMPQRYWPCEAMLLIRRREEK
jgi:hypothetical protein